MKYTDIVEAKKIYKKKQNVTEHLRKQYNVKNNSSEIIEIAYDLQAGSYIENTIKNRTNQEKTSALIASELNKFLLPRSTLLDIGSGELTNLTLILNNLNKIRKVFAFDISWSRIFKGVKFFKDNSKHKINLLYPFVADIKSIPLASNSIDVITSCHALEPNGRNLNLLLKELFRVAKDKLVLFEPSYELNSKEGKRRMEKYGYVKGIEKEVIKLGGIVKNIKLIGDPANSLNPTACYVISVNKKKKYGHKKSPKFTIPGSDFELKRSDNFMISKDTGLSFPILKKIPILKSELAILSTALFD
tara:strand:+ start:513 stop:1421 length:909 start_codon:yes stop_codon:yes gene_type:complete